MSFDGIFTHLMVDELNQQLSGGRISKIHQPYENEIILTIRSQGKNHKLLLKSPVLRNICHSSILSYFNFKKIYENLFVNFTIIYCEK